MPKTEARVDSLVVSCEHASKHIPPDYRALFRGRSQLLDSHRGWDRGALDLARAVARRYRAPLAAASASRLLVDCNRSTGHPGLFSAPVRALDDEQRDEILRRHYEPYRARVESLVAGGVDEGERVLHLSVHTFTPVLRGVARRADVGLLCDPRRALERNVVRRWREAIRSIDPRLRVWLNYPYRGWADGLTTSLRTRFPAARYAGVELEVNQAIVRRSAARWRRVQVTLVESLSTLVG